MAKLEDRLPDNAPGDFYVDGSCIDCDTCRQIAPAVFAQSAGEQSFVHHQPGGAEERRRASMALIACPTSSIGSLDRAAVKDAVGEFPEPIAPGIAYCGFTAESSFGASSYWIGRPGGNVLVDSPRAARPLMKRLEELGGLRLMFLTHRDDIADHQRYHEVFGCDRILHRRDVSRGTDEIERIIEGDDPVAIEPDLTIIPLPGHTRGSAALLFDETYLFTGDHLWWNEKSSRLHASRAVCWYSWAEQTRSMERLLDHRFEWVLPGHGRRYRAPSAAAMRANLERLVKWMRSTV